MDGSVHCAVDTYRSNTRRVSASIQYHEKKQTSIKRILLSSRERGVKERIVPKCLRRTCQRLVLRKTYRRTLCSVGEIRRKCRHEHKKKSQDDKFHGRILENNNGYFKKRSRTINTSFVYSESKLDTLIKRTKERLQVQNNYSRCKQPFQNTDICSDNKLHNFIKSSKQQSNITNDINNKECSVEHDKQYSDSTDDFWSSNNEHERRISKKSEYMFDKTLWDNDYHYQYETRRIPDVDNGTIISDEMDISIHSLSTVRLEANFDNEVYSPTSPTISITSPVPEMCFRNSIPTSYNCLLNIQQITYDNIKSEAYSPIMSPDIFVSSPKSSKCSIIPEKNDTQIIQGNIKQERDLNNSIIIKTETYDDYNTNNSGFSADGKVKLEADFDNNLCNATAPVVNDNGATKSASLELNIKSEPQY